MEKECIDYFKSNIGFRRLFVGLREKYRSLGNLGGIIKLNNLNELEKDALSGLLRKDYYNRKSASIRVEHIFKALEDTRFQGVDLEEVVKGYFKGELISKREEKSLYDFQREDFYRNIILKFNNSLSSKWLAHTIENKSNAYRILNQSYERDREVLKEILFNVMEGINSLSFNTKEPIRLALFSSIVSKNPHKFDDGTLASSLLLYGIGYALGVDYPINAEERAETLYKAGIIKDEISNYTTLSGFTAHKDGEIHEGWQGFYEKNEPVIISLWNLSQVDKIITQYKSIFVFENPTVFSEVLRILGHKKPALICTNGQLRLASLILMDRLAENIDYIYYSGDFDPEGLQIADKLKTRYGEKLLFWRFGIEEYESIKSSKKIESRRLIKLDKIKSPELQCIASHMRIEGYSAYQELLIDKYVYDINNLI